MTSSLRLLTDRAARQQAATIARATFDGFLQSDLTPQGMQAPALIWLAAFFVAPAIFLPVQALNKYSFIRRFLPERLEATFWGDRVTFLIMSAGAVGVVAVLLWDTLFPARRDAFVLTPLPVPLSAQMLGRLGGLIALCLVFVVGLNAIPAVLFPITSSGSFSEMPRAMAGHAVAACAADVFVFFSVTSIQGLVILALGRTTAGRIASVAQAGSVLFLLLGLLFIGGISAMTRAAILRGTMSDPTLQWLPVAWFLGLYDVIAGTPRAIMTPLAWRAIVATVAPISVTAAIYAFGYQRLLARAVETPPRSTRSWLTGLASDTIRHVFVRRPEEQAICGFVLRALSRSGRHSMLMSIDIGAALAMMITFVLPDVLRGGAAALAAPTVTALALPLVLSAALACGARIVITIPAEMGARWVFQMSGLDPRRADAATHKTLLLIVVPTVMLTAAVTAAALWVPRVAALHAIYCGSLALALCEALLITYRGIPLTRPYVPGASRFHLLWAIYLSAFLTYTLSAASLEQALLQWATTQDMVVTAGIFCGAALGLWAWRKVKLREETEVPFAADMPDDLMFQGFNLSEIQAAEAVAADGRQQRRRSV